MIDKLQRIAQTIQILRLPSIVVGLISLVVIVGIVFISRSNEGERFLIPSIAGLLWAISAYSFIVIFRFVPGKTDQSLNFLGKLKRYTLRGWYWFIGVFFLATTMAVMFVTCRIVAVWWRDHVG